MNITGIVRKIDTLGRIVIPIELRKALNMNIGDSVEIISENGSITLRKYENKCCICGCKNITSKIDNKFLCDNCIMLIKKI